MRKKVWITVYFLMIVGSVLGFVKMKEGAASNGVAVERVHEKKVFENNQKVYNNDVQKAIRAEKVVEKEVAIEAQEKKEVEETQRNGEGQIKVKF